MTPSTHWELNEEQRTVVFHEGGPLLVLAGAGSGKTRALTYRVAWLMEKGVPPSRIVLATFTNKAARSMLERVMAITGSSVPMLWGGTFHSIGHRVLRRHAELLGYGKDFTIVDAEEAKQIVTACVVEQVARRDARFPKADVIRDVWSYAVNTDRTVEEAVTGRFSHLEAYLDEMVAIIRAYGEKKGN